MTVDLTSLLTTRSCPACGKPVAPLAAVIIDYRLPSEEHWHMWCAMKRMDDNNG